MKKNILANGALEVTELCLGSMTWGTQNSEAEGHGQIDMALDHGINFVDTAEMYPVNPVRAETIGRTEEIIGSWNAKSGRRGDYVLATKVTGKSKLVRDGQGFTGPILRQTVEASLARLRTDYVDLYQLHWPQRGSYHFRQMWEYDPSGQDPARTLDDMREVLGVMTELVAAGKVRHFGLSNETAWGTAKWLELAREMGAPPVVTIQNEYSLLCRLYDADLAEVSVHEGVALLAYSPLATGILTGKYQGGTALPPGSRMTLNKDLGGRVTPRVWPAAQAYLDLAAKHGIDPVQMALRWAADRPFMGSVIFGATSEAQLARALGAADIALPEGLAGEIDAVHKAHPLPF